MKKYDLSLEGTKCPTCDGKGYWDEKGDLHTSPGIEPCPRAWFDGHGVPFCKGGILQFDTYDLLHWDKLKKDYP